MARMHSRKKGKSGSKKPSKQVKPTWIRYKEKEIEQIILKLVKEEKTTSQIGVILRDSYGIPDVQVILNKKISQILKENKVLGNIPEDLVALIKKEITISKHLENNKKDIPAKRGLELTESKIHRLSKYYKKSGRIPKDWKYDRSKAKLLIGLG
ncbi:30S ribosomal protein S15 [Candidatus Woesearchaeota archaeon]|nr:30S ribosomal protein S15 [Candidatus Woesearchaeota archaeon]